MVKTHTRGAVVFVRHPIRLLFDFERLAEGLRPPLNECCETGATARDAFHEVTGTGEDYVHHFIETDRRVDVCFIEPGQSCAPRSRW